MKFFEEQKKGTGREEAVTEKYGGRLPYSFAGL